MCQLALKRLPFHKNSAFGRRPILRAKVQKDVCGSYIVL